MKVELNRVVLVGTAHVSEKSVNEVKEAIALHDPDLVCVELDENRFKALTDKKKFEDTPITELLKGGKAPFILAHAMLASFQRRMGEKYGVEPGAEMLAAIQACKESGTEIVLADRDIGITLRRAWARMGFREKMRLGWEFTKALFGAEDEGDEVDVDEMLEDDVLTLMMSELAEVAPSVSQVLVHERDAYLARRIHEASARGSVVAVVGAGHMKGIQAYLAKPETLPDPATLETVPKKRVPWGKILGWGITAGILLILALYAFQGLRTGDFTALRDTALTWIVLTGGLSAIGALLARGHPYSIATAFLAAPFTTLHPALAAGWFAGAVEAKVRTPTVGDFQAVSRMQTLREFWTNRLTRVLLVTSLANVGAMIGFYLGGGKVLGDVLRAFF